MHGEPREPSWTRLAETAAAGATKIVLERPVSWRPGDRIVISSTELDPHQAEDVTIAAVDGNVIRLSTALGFEHRADTIPMDEAAIERRAEVGLLTRTIVLQGDSPFETDGLGGYTMVMPQSIAQITWTEFFHMGQKGILARYPVHFHVAGDMSGSYVRDSSIHHSFNRCFTIHGTHGIVAERNVAFDAIGHCYFFEDGIEAGNELVENLGVLTRRPEPGYALLESDLTPATFWISHPDNAFIGNVAAGSEARGFWFDLPLHPTGLSKSAVTDWTVWPRRTPLRTFRDNLAHSNQDVALLVGSPTSDTGPVRFTPKLRPIPSPSGADSPPAIAQFEGFTAYLNHVAFLLLGEDLELADPVIDEPDFPGKTSQ
jgi:cell migration-inducing and hyaluronan-binding protein